MFTWTHLRDSVRLSQILWRNSALLLRHTAQHNHQITRLCKTSRCNFSTNRKQALRARVRPVSHNFRALHVLKIVFKNLQGGYFLHNITSKDRDVDQTSLRLHRWTFNVGRLLQKWKDLANAADLQTTSNTSWMNTIIIISILQPQWCVSPAKEDQRKRLVWIPTGQTRPATRGKYWPNFKIPRRRGRRVIWELLGSKAEVKGNWERFFLSERRQRFNNIKLSERRLWNEAIVTRLIYCYKFVVNLMDRQHVAFHYFVNSDHVSGAIC